MEPKADRYQAYMLRLWQVEQRGRAVWRVSLDNAHTRERLGFGSLDELFHYLQQQTSDWSDVQNGSDEKAE